MYKARYYKSDGAEGGEQQLPDWLFDGVVNEPALHQAVKVYLANRRQGTASAKSRGQVRGGSRKAWRQKGTGRARVGTIRAAHWEGGGVAFPPIPHSWRQKLPKRMRALAHRSAYNARAEGERVILIDGLEFETPKTKRLLEFLDKVGATGKVLLLTDGAKAEVYRSATNLSHVITKPFGQESVYEILWATHVLIEVPAIESGMPSVAHELAMASRGYTPQVRIDDQAEAEAQAEHLEERRLKVKARKDGVAAKNSGGEPVAEAAKPKAKAKAKKAAAKPKAATPKADVAPVVEAADAGSGDIDVATVKLPKVGDLGEFLAQFSSVEEIVALQARDARKTAQAQYESRMAELSGDNEADDE